MDESTCDCLKCRVPIHGGHLPAVGYEYHCDCFGGTDMCCRCEKIYDPTHLGHIEQSWDKLLKTQTKQKNHE